MKRRVVKTADGSHTLEIGDGSEHYHSTHGAIQEARHVFIKMGLQHAHRAVEAPRILEIGFGTGLNALLTLEYIISNQAGLDYVGLEAFPLKKDEWSALNYADLVSWSDSEKYWKLLHESPWEEVIELYPGVQLEKREQKVLDFAEQARFDIVYFDAFGPRHQPDMWTDEVFKIVFDALDLGGVLVTYSAKGEVRRTMQRVGFDVERLPGPPGKREMLRATKPMS